MAALLSAASAPTSLMQMSGSKSIVTLPIVPISSFVLIQDVILASDDPALVDGLGRAYR